MEPSEIIEALTEIVDERGKYSTAAHYAIQAINSQNKFGKWRQTGLVDKETGLFNCGNCLKVWTAPRNSDLYKMGFHHCPNCGIKMLKGEKE